MLADSHGGRSLLSNRASGLRHYFHLTKGTRIEKKGDVAKAVPTKCHVFTQTQKCFVAINQANDFKLTI